MAAQYVQLHVKTNKSDYIDAEAIAEAVGRPKMRFVPVSPYSAGNASRR
jgi:transposase